MSESNNIKNIKKLMQDKIQTIIEFVKDKYNLAASIIKQKWAAYDAKEHLTNIKNKPLLAKVKQSPMIIMLILLSLFFGGIFVYQAIQAHFIKQYLKSQANPPVAVSTIKVEKQAWQPKFKASGSLRTIRGVEVTTEISGLIRSIEFEPGALVNAGDILVKLNTDTEIAQLHSLEAQAELAKITYERDVQQYAIKAISKAVLDADLANLNDKVAQVAAQNSIIAKKNIAAPFTGRLGVSTVNLGQYLNVGDKIVPLQTLDPIFFDFYVPQQMIPKLAVGQTVTVSSDIFSLKPIAGKITAMDPVADPETRNVLVEATIENAENLLLPGMFAQVEVNIGATEEYLTLPQTAISFNPYGELVYIVNDSGKKDKGEPILTVKQSFVTVGSTRGDQVAVLTGLKEGDIVVTAGQHKLRNGSRVFINNSVPIPNNINPNVVNE